MAAKIGDFNFEKIRKIMDEFNFQSTNKVHADYLCTLCRKLINDARVCQCSCRFCNKCITEYVSNGNSFCPGKSNECKDESLNPEVNIWIDHITNRKIGKVIVNCPVEMCSHNDCLMDIEEHVRGCASQSVRCPYSHIGCDYLVLEEENINHHLKSQKDQHIQIMIKKIEKVQSENENLRNQSENLKNENLRNQTDNLKKENLRNQIDELKVQNKNLKKQIQSLQDSCDSIQKRMEEEKCQLRLAKNTEVDDLNEQIDRYKSNLKSYFDANPKEFKWTVTDWEQLDRVGTNNPDDDDYLFLKTASWSDRRLSNTILYSKEFYTPKGGYKMQLELERIDDNYRLYLAMVGDDYNSNFLWPVKLDITAGIISRSSSSELFLKSDRKIADFGEEGRTICFSFCPSNITQCDALPIKCVVKVLM